MKTLDLSVYLVTDPSIGGPSELAALAAAAVDGGATLVQLRDKQAGTRALMAAAEALQAVLAPRRVPLIVNDRVDVALAVGAAGVHLGQEDMPAPVARRLIGDRALLGLSIGAEDEIDPAAIAVADYAGIGPLWPTGSKDDAAIPLGPAGLGGLRRLVPLPVVAIGGINAARTGDIIAAGADGVAVIAAITQAADPKTAAAELAAAVAAARSSALVESA